METKGVAVTSTVSFIVNGGCMVIPSAIPVVNGPYHMELKRNEKETSL